MASCEKCGNEYDKTFDIEMHGKRYTFDCFECAIAVLAPRCDHCDVPIIGHGLEANGKFFCCEHCAEEAGVMGLRDRV